MKLYLLLCLSFVPWTHGFGHRGQRATQKPSTPIQPQVSPQGCPTERMRNANDLDNDQKGDKFEAFDWNLSKELNALERGNIVISPISLKVVLAMLYEGARGMTALEIGQALDLYNTTAVKRSISRDRFALILDSLQTSEDEYKIKIGTHAFIDKSAQINFDYQCKLKNYYESDIVKVDFSNPSEAIKQINSWAKNATEGHIQDLISESEAEPTTIMMLLNAVYFKGQWEIPFPTNQTKEENFYLKDQKVEKVPLMNVLDKFKYKDLPDIGAHMIELPYKGNKFSMFVILPHNKGGLDTITNILSPDRPLSGVIDSMVMTTVNLTMPKFEYDYAIKLRPTLQKMGIKTMFTSEAELEDIARPKIGSLKVSGVLQKAGISVTEAGTVAYAASAVEIGNKFGGAEEIIDFKVDRPFLFFIEDTTTKTTVFVGKVTNPSKVKVVSTPQEAAAETPSAPASPTPEDRFGSQSPSQNVVPESDEYTSPGKFNFFDGELLQKVAAQEKGNFVISPASIKTLLGLILEGSEGVTQQELREVLRLPNNVTRANKLMGSLRAALQRRDNSKVKVDAATRVYIAKDLKHNSSYEAAISDLYDAGIENLDFKTPASAAERINNWVKRETRNEIPSLISPGVIDPDTISILVNTIYFNANWKDEFLPKDVKNECFYSEPKLDCHKVPMMYRKDELPYRYHNDFNSHIVQLPYKDERFSMVLVVPENIDGSRRIVRDLNKLTLPGLLDRARPNEVHLKLPKFTVEYDTELKNALTQMGLNTVFSHEANLPYMINKRQGQVSKLIHKAKIEVSEKGTKASAATGAVVVPLMSGNEAANVTADHPFYYFIYESENRTVLFSGRISSLGGETSSSDSALSPDDLTPYLQSGPAPESTASNGYEGYDQSWGSDNQPSRSPSRPQSNPNTGVIHQGAHNSNYNKEIHQSYESVHTSQYDSQFHSQYDSAPTLVPEHKKTKTTKGWLSLG